MLSAAAAPRLAASLRPALAAAGVLLFFTNAVQFLWAWAGGPTPALWTLAFVATAALLVALEPDRPLALLRSPLLLWVALSFAVTTAWGLAAPPAATQLLQDRYRSMAFLVAFAAVAGDPAARRAGLWAVGACAALLAVLDVAEFLRLIDLGALAGYDRPAGRAAGLFPNPNGAALAIALGVAAAGEALPRWSRVPLILLAAFGVAATFSRGGMACLVLAALWLAWRRALGAWRVALGACVGVVAVLALSELASAELLTENTLARLRAEAGDSGRAELARRAWEMFASAPFLGHGLGATLTWGGDQGPHNTYLALAAEHGLLGLVLLPALGLALASRREARGFTLVLLLGGALGHGLLEARYALVLIALAAGGGDDAPPGPG